MRLLKRWAMGLATWGAVVLATWGALVVPGAIATRGCDGGVVRASDDGPVMETLSPPFDDPRLDPYRRLAAEEVHEILRRRSGGQVTTDAR
jgi:hypothetical protein